MLLNRKPKEDDHDTFAKRIRQAIEEKTGETSGIKVFEHSDESALDDYEKQVLNNLRKAHEEWQAKNPKGESEKTDDAYKSVRARLV